MSSSFRPEITISPMVPEDYEAIAGVFFRSFEKTDIMNAMYPPDRRPPLEKRIVLQVASRLKRSTEPLLDLVEIKATLPSSCPSSPPIVVGGATWLSPVDRTSTSGEPLPSELAIAEELKLRPRLDWEDAYDATKDQAFFERFIPEALKIRKEWSGGRRHWYLSYIYVDPSHAGKGIGSALLQYGTDRADQEGIPTWLESTPAGRPVYEKHGFVIKSWAKVTGDGFDQGVHRWPGMEREYVSVEKKEEVVV